MPAPSTKPVSTVPGRYITTVCPLLERSYAPAKVLMYVLIISEDAPAKPDSACNLKLSKPLRFAPLTVTYISS